MNKKVLDFINKCEGWKTGIKSLHWDADNMSQHELCDDIADRIADFQDQVSEVEQSITGKLAVGNLKPTAYKVTNLKKFVEDVLDETNTFYKSLEDEGDTYTGMKSDCESFLSDMQRNLYLVNFTMKEDFKRTFAKRINESRPKNLENVVDIDKFMGRRPKTMKARINQIYRIIHKYNIDGKLYRDDHWQAVDDYHRAISSLGCDVQMFPCANLNKPDWDIQGDGGYCDYAEDGMPRSKQYKVIITYEDGMKVEGYAKMMAAGSVQDPFDAYDTCMVLWPKSNRVIEGKEDMNKQISLTEAELKQIVKEAAIKVLTETPLNYDIDNFSGRWSKSDPSDEEMALADAQDDYLDNPFNPPNSWDDEEWVDGDKDMEKDYSWWLRERPQEIRDKLAPKEVDGAIFSRKKDTDWSDSELRQGQRMMDRWVQGKRSPEQIGDAWEDLHYESKKPRKVTEESIDIDPKNKGKFTATKKATGKSTEELTHSKNPLTRKRANFAKMAKRHWKPLKDSK